MTEFDWVLIIFGWFWVGKSLVVEALKYKRRGPLLYEAPEAWILWPAFLAFAIVICRVQVFE